MGDFATDRGVHSVWSFWKHMFYGWLVLVATIVMVVLVESFTSWKFNYDIFLYMVPPLGLVWVFAYLYLRTVGRRKKPDNSA